MKSHKVKETHNVVTNKKRMVLGAIKLQQAHMVLSTKQNQNQIMSRDLDFDSQTICCKRDVLRVFEAKLSSALFALN